MSLFEQAEAPDERAPLAARLRPKMLDEFVGQDHLVGANAPTRGAIERGTLGSVLLWGPPGSGKTTLARLVAQYADAHLEARSAVTTGVGEIKKITEAAKLRPRRTLLFLDEIHHFTRTQQDSLLAAVEEGALTLIGATTENPAFSLAGPLISRCRVLILKPLSDEQTVEIARRGAAEIGVSLEPEAEAQLARWANGDARAALNAVEFAAQLAHPNRSIATEHIAQAMNRPVTRYDAKGDQHYDVISAFIKSVRGSDADAALHYLARMIRAGEDPRFIARRLVILASEDIGNAEPLGLLVAMAAFHVVERIGMPEAALTLAQAVIFLAASPKSNSATTAIGKALSDLERLPAPPVPRHLRDANTKIYEDRGVAPQVSNEPYKYPHAFGGWVKQEYLPKGHGLDVPYYVPLPQGYETKLKAFLDSLKASG